MAPKAKSSKSSSSSSSSSSDAISTKRISARLSAHSTARVGLLSGLIEGTLVMMELIFGLSIVRSACQASYRTLNSLPAGEEPPPFNAFCIHVAANLVVCFWLIFRMSQKHQPTTTVTVMADKLSLWPLPRAVSKDTLNMLGKVFMLHFVGTGGMALIQYLTGHWIFSFQNYYSEDAGADYITAADMLLFAPLREELTFRGMIFTIFYLRGVAYKATPTVKQDDSTKSNAVTTTLTANSDESLAWTAAWKLDCVIASAVTFGLVHLLNLFGNRYTTTYIVLQIFLGMTLGAFYCFRFVLSQNSLLEAVLLHMINNFFSSFLPVKQELDLTSPLVFFPLMLTFLVYGTLTYQQYKKLIALPPKPFGILTQSDAESPIPNNQPTVTDASSTPEQTGDDNKKEQ